MFERFVSTVSIAERIWLKASDLVQLLFMLVCALIAVYAPIAGRLAGRYLGRLIRIARDHWPSIKAKLVSYLPIIKDTATIVADYTIKAVAIIAVIAVVITVTSFNWLTRFIATQMGDGIIWEA